MTGGQDQVERQTAVMPRSSVRPAVFILIAAGLALFGAVAGAYYFAMRPVILHIAVGPPNSDDLKVVQALTQSFTQNHNYVRLRPVPTEGAAESAQALADGKVDLAIVRGDLNVPKNAQAVATLRKNVVVLWVPAGTAKGKKKADRITKISQLAGHKVGVIGRTPANVNLLKVILQQYGVDPDKVETIQFPITEAADAIKNHKADVYLAAGPVNSKITTDAVAASTKNGEAPTFLGIDSADAIAQNHSEYEVGRHSGRGLRRRARPSGGRGQDNQLQSPHRCPQGPVGHDRRGLHASAVRGPPAIAGRLPACRQDRDARHR